MYNAVYYSQALRHHSWTVLEVGTRHPNTVT